MQQIVATRNKPPITLIFVLVNVLLFLQPEGVRDFVPAASTACLQPFLIVTGKQYGRLLWSAFLHADERHLLVNMSSLLWKGSLLEPAMGCGSFLFLVTELLIVSQATHHEVWGIRMPGKYVCWVELILIQLVTPRASLLGHFSGILAGILHLCLVSFSPLAFRFPRGVRRQQYYRMEGEPHFATSDGQRPAASDAADGYESSPSRADSHRDDHQAENYGSWWFAGARGRRRAGRQGYAPRLPGWRSVRKWPASILLGALLVIAAVTNPSQEHFTTFVSDFAHRKLGFLPGLAAKWAMASPVWMGGVQHWNCYLFSLARTHRFWFLGAYGFWLPLPVVPLWALSAWARWQLRVGPLQSPAYQQ
ncbi:hypothetical protein WJX73_005858 [Symbiochloris irregularis]|uniref:Peptidase S54 rhomboid domain-containing protein n=1 Tax=Symbiochloris irregularis TaxID=706552 RepID=A0AAW1NT70_9CHLO